MDKTELVKELVTKLLKKADTTSRGSKSARQASIEAPSKMQSRYDSTKSEQDWLSHALAMTSAQTRREIQDIKVVDLTPSEKVRVGSLVTIKAEGQENVERYFILPAGSGTILQRGTAQQVTMITPASPLGAALIGKTVGTRCEVKVPRGSRFFIITSAE